MFSQDHPRIAALEQALRAIASCMAPEMRQAVADRLAADVDRLTAAADPAEPERALVAVEIAAAIQQIRDDMLRG